MIGEKKMKAILVIDIKDGEDFTPIITVERAIPLPKKKWEWVDAQDTQWNDGWNACIEEILGNEKSDRNN